MKQNSRKWITSNRLDSAEIASNSPLTVINQILAEVGASIGLDEAGEIFERRDEVDKRILADVKNGTGKIIDDPSDVGGWPLLAAGVPPTDTDHDAMSDQWERQYGFNPLDLSDGSLDKDRDGYTNVEEYLNASNPLQIGS